MTESVTTPAAGPSTCAEKAMRVPPPGSGSTRFS